MKQIKVKLTFTEGILGTSPGNEDIYREYIAGKAPDAASIEEEVAALGAAEVTEKAKTVFPRTDAGIPFIYDYQIKGFFKDTCGGLRKVKGTESSKIKAFKKEIDKLIFIEPREIPFEQYGVIGECQRPLRASTPMGERVSLAISEEIPAGAVWNSPLCCYPRSTRHLCESGWTTVDSPASVSGVTVARADSFGRRSRRHSHEGQSQGLHWTA